MLASWRDARVSGRRAVAQAEQTGWRDHEVRLHAVDRRRVTCQYKVGCSRESACGRQEPGRQARLGHPAEAPAGTLGVGPKEGSEGIKASLLFRCASVLAAAISAATLS